METSKKFFAVIDIGSTSVRAVVYNRQFEIVALTSRSIEVLFPKHGYVEIDPEKLFSDVLAVFEEAVQKSNLNFGDVVLGISTQRSTFTTWSKSTGKVFHNFICWNDIRADSIVRTWNKSWKRKALNFGAKLAYTVTRKDRFLAGSVLKLWNYQITPSLLWVLENNANLRAAVKNKDAYFGTLESYLLYRLRSGKTFEAKVEHIGDVTNCTATGLYDPFTLQWAGWGITMFNLQIEMLPKVVDSSYEYGDVHHSFFNHPIKIAGVMADQAASTLGNGCTYEGEAKATLGTGSFFSINSGPKCWASVFGLYPLVIRILRGEKACYCIEGASSDTATIINWGQSIGLYNDPSETSAMAESVESSEGVYFIPAFSGLQTPINDFRATSGFIGITVNTTKNHLVRALLESLVFRVAQLLETSMKETDYKLKLLRVDGGVSKNDFICQALADLCQLNVERSENSENTSLGIAYLCAFNMKLVTIDGLRNLYKSGKIFKPRIEKLDSAVSSLKRFEDAIKRFKKWYK